MKLSIAAAIGLLALTVTEAVKVNPLPKPVDIAWGKSGAIRVSNGFTIVGPKNDIIQKAIRRTASIIKSERWVPQSWEQPMPEWPEYPTLDKRGDEADAEFEVLKNGGRGTVKTVNVKVADLKADLQHGVDESYTLDVTASGTATINAKTIWGALHGLSTFQQIVISDGKGLLIEQPVSIKDAPKFPHRGVMYDTARNFLPIKTLRQQIDALSLSKLNVLHWHMTDSQSWPVEIKKHPKFLEGAYSNKEIYTQKDIVALVQYGRERGVRVFPEIDMPAHSNKGWASVDPKTITCGDSWWDNDGWTHHSAVQPNPGHLDIAYPGTYKLLKDVYGEISKLFKDNIFHVGYDELIRYCYNYSEPSMEWFKNHPDATYGDFGQIWVDQALPIFYDRPKRRLMMWEDSVMSADFAANDIPKDVIMQSWNNGIDNIKALTKKGYDVVVTSADFFYLDCGHGGYVTNDPRYNEQTPPKASPALQAAYDKEPGKMLLTSVNYGGPGASWCAPYKTWQRIYNYDFTAGLSAKEAKKVIGGEAAMWSEQTDATNLDTKVWPRAAALAELLWSGNRDAEGYKRTTELSTRLFDFRERLVSRGINASPVVPKFCIQNPHHCDLNLDQRALGK